jgi:hypothetical protein
MARPDEGLTIATDAGARGEVKYHGAVRLCGDAIGQ